MSYLTTAPFAIFLDLTMIIYTLWVISLGDKNGRLSMGLSAGMLAWLGLLHFGLSTKSIFPENISSIAFLIIVFIAVGAVGASVSRGHPNERKPERDSAKPR